MAEASPQPGRYFCHCCSVEIVPRLPVRSGREGGGAVRARRARGEAETRWRASSVAGRSEDPGLRRGGPSAGRVALVGLSGDRDAELRAGDGRRARGQDAGTRSATSSAAPGLAAAPIEATNPTPQSGGVWSVRTDTPPGCNRPCATASMWLWSAAPPEPYPGVPKLPAVTWWLWVDVSRGPHQSISKPPGSSRWLWACVPRGPCLGILGPPASSSG